MKLKQMCNLEVYHDLKEIVVLEQDNFEEAHEAVQNLIKSSKERGVDISQFDVIFD